MKLEDGTAERVDTAGGVLLDVTMGGTVYMGYTGPCFDCRELTKGKAEHQTWNIPWNELLFFKPSNHKKYLLKTINQDEYRETAIERMKFLIGEYPERRYEIIEKMPGRFEGIKTSMMENVINQVLIPLYMQKSELLQDGLEKFDVELNILKNGKIVPMEICRPERFLLKFKEVKKDETR